jgi:multidrug efflux pump subunit AcrB
MSMSAYWNIRTRLLQVPGVANVAIWNERLQMMTVQVEPARLAARGVTLDQVMETTADAVDSGLLRFSSGSVIGTGGTIESANQRLPVRNVLPIITPADLAKVPIKGGAAGSGATRSSPGGATSRVSRPSTLGDVALVGRTTSPSSVTPSSTPSRASSWSSRSCRGPTPWS